MRARQLKNVREKLENASAIDIVEALILALEHPRINELSRRQIFGQLLEKSKPSTSTQCISVIDNVNIPIGHLQFIREKGIAHYLPSILEVIYGLEGSPSSSGVINTVEVLGHLDGSLRKYFRGNIGTSKIYSIMALAGYTVKLTTLNYKKIRVLRRVKHVGSASRSLPQMEKAAIKLAETLNLF